MANSLERNQAPFTWPIDKIDADSPSLQQQVAEQQLVNEVQSNMLDTLTAAQPFDTEVLKTMAVFRKNAEDDRKLLQVVIRENEGLKAQLAAADHRYQEAEKTQAAEKLETKKLFDELRAEIKALNAKLLSQEKATYDRITAFQERFDKHETRFNYHHHRDGYTHHVHYTSPPTN